MTVGVIIVHMMLLHTNVYMSDSHLKLRVIIFHLIIQTNEEETSKEKKCLSKEENMTDELRITD